jgi:hypothetical protein
MKDDKGLYYHPNPRNKRVRMYVREFADELEFRLWNQDVPELWDEHGWVSYEAIQQAARMYKGQSLDPQRVYDLNVASALIEEGK